MSEVTPIEVPYASHKLTIPVEKVAEVKAVLEKVIAYGQKRGFQLLSYKLSSANPLRFGENNMFVIPCMNLEITQPIVAMGEYHLVGKLEHGEKGANNFVLKGDIKAIPAQYHNCPPNCDHCLTARERNVTWIVRHKEKGDYAQIGTSCITEYTMYNSAEDAVRCFDVVNEMLRILGRYDRDQFYLDNKDELSMGDGRSYRYEFDVAEIIRTTLGVIARCSDGYVSKDKAEEHRILSTGDMVKSMYSKDPCFKSFSREPYEEEANQIIQWVKDGKLPEKIKLSTYGFNLKAILENGSVSFNRIGLIVPAVAFYNQARLEKMAEMNTAPSVHQGNPGERITRRLRVINVHSYPTNYGSGGTQYITLMSDEVGNAYKWNTASRPHYARNEFYTVVGTVKAHEVYKGTNQTELLRVKFKELELIEKICPRTVTPSELSSLLSKLDDPHIRLRSNGNDMPLHKHLDQNGAFWNLELALTYLQNEKVDPKRVFLETKFVDDLIKYRDDFEDKEEFGEIVEMIGRHTDIDISELRSELTASPT